MNLASILDLNRLAQQEGALHREKRGLYGTIRSESGRHFVGIIGPRGAGKTILLRQLASESAESCYVSLDTLPSETDLFELVRELSERYHFRKFFLDEVHYADDSLGAMKKIYDFLNVHIVFTSSVALRIRESVHDLARRVRLHTLDYFSFREYLQLKDGLRLTRLTIDHLLNGEIASSYIQVEDRFQAYLSGGLMPYSLEEPEPMPLLESTIETIINRDIPSLLRLHIDELDKLSKMLVFVGRSGIDGINYTSLSDNLGITKYKAEQYVELFEKAFLMQRLWPSGTNVLKEPKVLLMPPVRLLYRPLKDAWGGLREDFVALAMRQAQLSLHYLKGTRGQKTPDFHLHYKGENIVFEVGGKGKGREQFKGIHCDRKMILAENGSPWTPQRMPLHLLGFLA